MLRQVTAAATRWHCGIARRYQNIELLGALFHHLDLKTFILVNFISLAADIIFWVMRSMWKCAKKQISHLHIAWVAKVFERWTSYILEMVNGGLFKFQKYVHGGSSKIPFPLFIYHSLQCIHKFIVKRKNTKYVTGRHIRNLGSLIKKSRKGR